MPELLSTARQAKEDLMPLIQEMRSRADEHRDLCRQLREMIVARLDLPVDPDWITDDQPLFGRGLELDSIDAMELVVGLHAKFGIMIDDDDKGIFGSIAQLAQRILDEQ
jgi:acyl carrier protein